MSAAPETVAIPVGGSGLEPFLLGRTAVTHAEYAALVATGRVGAPPWWSHPDFSTALQPVVGVSWHDATAYCEWLSETSGRRWRLPDEREWEHAACGGLEAPRTAWGSGLPDGEVPDGPLRGPWEVGRGSPNGYGLCDMGTIVHEWCRNWCEEDHSRSPRRRASRGGSWRHAIRWSSPAASSSLPPGYRYSDYGFRVLCEARSKNGLLSIASGVL